MYAPGATCAAGAAASSSPSGPGRPGGCTLCAPGVACAAGDGPTGASAESLMEGPAMVNDAECSAIRESYFWRCINSDPRGTKSCESV